MLKKLAKRNRVITRSKTLAVAAKAAKLKKSPWFGAIYILQANSGATSITSRGYGRFCEC